ncbi:MAG: 8-amino-7-oxononanoate synthase, partial [Candidatus Omnitrophica bacterium]|nr:8-amino-7-oxononanoate synthase [Candidatus Omnitrophota bacterium]
MNESFLQQDLQELEANSMRRHLRTVETSQGRQIVIDGKTVLNFCSNNYLGLADDEDIQEAAMAALRRYGYGSGASRLICGNM